MKKKPVGEDGVSGTKHQGLPPHPGVGYNRRATGSAIVAQKASILEVGLILHLLCRLRQTPLKTLTFFPAASPPVVAAGPAADEVRSRPQKDEAQFNTMCLSCRK